MKKKEIDLMRDNERKEIVKITEKDRIKAKCDHKNQHGKSTLRPTNDPNIAKCKICGAKVVITPKDLKELDASTKDIIEAVQYIKAAYRGDNEEILKALGDIIISMEQLTTWYSNAVASRRKREDQQPFDGVNGTMYISTGNFNGFGLPDNYSNKKKKKKHKKNNKGNDIFGW